MVADRGLVLVRDGVTGLGKTHGISRRQALGLGRVGGRRSCGPVLHVDLAVVAVLGYLGGLDDTVAVDLEEVNDAAGEVGSGGEEAGAGELVGAAHQDLGEFDGARLGVEVEGLDTLVALELDEAVAVGVAADVEAVEGAVVDARVLEVEVLGVLVEGGVDEDHVDFALLHIWLGGYKL